MKYLLLSLVLITSSAVQVVHAGNLNKLSERINQEISVLNSAEAKTFEDFALPNEFTWSAKSKADLQTYKQAIEMLANNEIRSESGKAFTQTEANLLIKYFLQLNLDFDDLLSPGFRGSWRIASIRDNVQAIQIIENIANTRKDMDEYLELGDVKCFFRNYKDPNTEVEGVKMTYALKQMPLAEILKRSEEAIVVGKCRGCGLLKLPEFAFTEEQNFKFPTCVN